MRSKDLISLGFTLNESLVYLSIISFGRAKANEIIRDTGLHKKIVYENIERLIDKGLVSFIQEGRTRIFTPADPNMLVELFQEKQEEIARKTQEAKDVAEKIRKLAKKEVTKEEATLFRGKKGIRTFYNELLRIGEDYCVFGAPASSIDMMEEHFWLNLVQKKREKKISARILFNRSNKEYGDKIRDRLTDIRYLDKDFEPMTEINIQKDRVATIVWKESPYLFLVKDRVVAESYMQYFEKMWKESRS